MARGSYRADIDAEFGEYRQIDWDFSATYQDPGQAMPAPESITARKLAERDKNSTLPSGLTRKQEALLKD